MCAIYNTAINEAFEFKDYLWIADIISLCILLYVTKIKNELNSSTISLITAVCVSTLSYYYEYFLCESLDENSVALFRFAWYMGFVLLDCIAIYLIYKSHIVLQVRFRFIARMIVGAYFIQGLCHLVRYFERVHWGTNLLSETYRIMNISINTGTTMVAFGIIAVVGYHIYTGKEQLSGKIWQL